MRILVTGGAGFIGSHTADALLGEGHEVRVMDALVPPVHPQSSPPSYLSRDIEWIDGDVRDPQAWIRAVRDVDAIYHLAAYQDYLLDYSRFFEVNVVSVGLMYEAIAATGADLGRIVVASSQAVYGDGRYTCPSCDLLEFRPASRTESQLASGDWDVHCPRCGTPSTPIWSTEEHSAPQNAYALSKRAGEESALVLARRDGIDAVAMRYSIVQGPRQSPWNSYSGALRIFAQRARAGLSPLCYEDGLQQRDYVNVTDVVAANLLVLEHGDAPGRAFNVGGGRAYTVMDLAEAVAAATGNEQLPPLVPGAYRVGDARHSLSSTAALESLGWSASVPVEESIAQYVAWIDGLDVPIDTVTEAARRMDAAGVTRKTASGRRVRA